MKIPKNLKTRKKKRKKRKKNINYQQNGNHQNGEQVDGQYYMYQEVNMQKDVILI